MAHETRACGACEEGVAWTCGNGPGDRRENVTCPACGGSGEVTVWVYESKG